MAVITSNNSKSPSGKPKILRLIVIVVVTLVIGLPLVTIGGFFAQCVVKDFRMSRSAEDKEEVLAAVGIVQNAEGVKNGDCLTASTNTSYSTWAYGTQTASGRLDEVEVATFEKLKTAGYVRDGGDQNPKYSPSNAGLNIPLEGVRMRYVKGEDVVAVDYKFVTKQSCPDGYNCWNHERLKFNKEPYHVSGFKAIELTSIRATYGAAVNNYAVGWR